MDEIAQIKDRLDILEIISSYLTVKKAGVNYKATCPFHTEKTPSFMISPERQTFKCFGCGEGGDIFTFIEKMEGIDFYNALKILADRAGVKLAPKSIRHNDRDYQPDQTTKLFEINDWAAKVYHKILTDHPKAVKARSYLEKRGLSEKTIEEFNIGYAPNSWDFLIKFLSMKKYDEKEVFKAGLLVQRQGGGFYDRFRGRITFPINNIMGATVGFTTRLLDDNPNPPAGGAKYINSAESPIYKKSKIIYGLDRAKMAIKAANLAIVVEGNMDVIACHQAGFKNVVASSGTALTIDQLKILTRYSPDIAFSFDSDNAGQAAMKKAVALALQNDISTKIISLPLAYKDPDEAIKANPKHWSDAVEKAKPSLEYWIDLLIKNAKTLDVSTKKNIAREILPIIKIIYSDIEKEHYIKYLSMRLGISEQSLNQALQKSKSILPENRNEEKKIKPENLDIYARLAGVLWGDLKIKDKILASPTGGENIKNLRYSGEDKVLFKFYEYLSKDQLVESLFNDEEKNQLNQISLTVLADFDDKNDENLLAEAEYLLKTIERGDREQIKQEFVAKIKQAEADGDTGKIKELMEELSGLIK